MPDLTLGQKQRVFARLVGTLLARIYEQGYECSLGEAMRSDEQAAINALGVQGRADLSTHLEQVPQFHTVALAVSNNVGGGILLSLHRDALAIDLNLFKDGKYLAGNEDHRPFGEWWCQQHELCRWGGNFKDGNHYSVTHNGRQ
jgi:hypothetical protein